MPNAGKWWILTPKTKLDEVYTFLNEELQQHMSKSALDHDYLPPCDIPLRNTEQTSNTTQQNEYTSALLLRLKQRPTPTIIHHTPPPTGRIRSYATVASHNTPTLITQTSKEQEDRARQHTAELKEIRKAITSIQGPTRPEDQIIKDMTLAINKMKSAATKTTSTLTESE